jgi:hypothetical protein
MLRLAAAGPRGGAPDLSIGRICDLFQRRTYAVLIFIMAAPNALPMPPGTSIVTGLPLLVIAWQMMLGYQQPWLPEAIRARAVPPGLFRATDRWIGPALATVDRQLRPRLTILLGRPVQQLVGALLLLVAIVILVPLPLSNLVPSAGAALIGLALLRRDGLALLLGVLVTLVGLAIFVSILLTLYVAVDYIAEEIAEEIQEQFLEPPALP